MKSKIFLAGAAACVMGLGASAFAEDSAGKPTSQRNTEEYNVQSGTTNGWSRESAVTQPAENRLGDDMRARMSNGLQTDPAREGLRQLIRSASDSYGAIARNVPTEVKSRANCIAVFPDVTKIAALVGGRHGDGLAACRSSEGRWGQVAFVDLTGASFGTQIGKKDSSVALFFMGDDAQAELERGKFTLGTDVSLVAGDEVKKFSDSDFDGVVAYELSTGTFAGAAAKAARVSVDQDAQQAFYGDSVDYLSVLRGTARQEKSAETEALINQFRSAS